LKKVYGELDKSWFEIENRFQGNPKPLIFDFPPKKLAKYSSMKFD
jgi:hypothetical protein